MTIHLLPICLEDNCSYGQRSHSSWIKRHWSSQLPHILLVFTWKSTEVSISQYGMMFNMRMDIIVMENDMGRCRSLQERLWRRTCNKLWSWGSSFSCWPFGKVSQRTSPLPIILSTLPSFSRCLLVFLLKKQLVTSKPSFIPCCWKIAVMFHPKRDCSRTFQTRTSWWF